MGRFAILCLLLGACGFSAHVGSSAGDDAGLDPDALGKPADWPKRRKLTIDNTGIGALTNFPLAVQLSNLRIDYTATKARGADVRIGDATSTFYPYEIESWDPAGVSIVWVRVPAIAANATTELWLYYGNPNAIDAQTPAAVWDTDYVGVWHMANGTDASGRLSGSANNGGVALPGRLGSALLFSTADAHVDTTSTEYLAKWTVEAWMKPTNPGTTQNGASAIVSGYPNYMLLWGCNDSAFCKKVMYQGSQTATHVAGYDGPLATWTHITGRYDGATLKGYISGVESGTETTSDAPLTMTVSAKIGSRMDLAGDFIGAIDEVRISRVARSLDYIRANVRSQSDAYVTYGPEEAN